MAASMNVLVPFFVLMTLSVYEVDCTLQELGPDQVLRAIEDSCVFVLLSRENEVLWNNFLKLSVAFPSSDTIDAGTVSAKDFKDVLKSSNTLNEVSGKNLGVSIGYHEGEFSWDRDEPLIWMNQDKIRQDDYRPPIAFFSRRLRDRKCLLNTPQRKPMAEIYNFGDDVKSMVDFLNSRCGTFQTVKGQLSRVGRSRDSILKNLFHVSEISNITMGSVLQVPNGVSTHGRKIGRNHQSYSFKANTNDKLGSPTGMPDEKYVHEFPRRQVNNLKNAKIGECERISRPLSKEEFFYNFLSRSKPFVLVGAVKQWRAYTKWTKAFLHDKYGDKEVHIKLAPNGIFEGVEDISLWEDHGTFQIPSEVYDQLPFPDLVVVRPGTGNIKFSEFLKTMDMTEQPESCYVNRTRVSAYLEYSSVRTYFKELEDDLEEFEMASAYLQLKHLNIWLSDGNTLGKLHFDPYDNLLCQIRGKKQLTLFEPHQNRQLYEAHIQEALLGYNNFSKTFRRKTLLDSTSMVMAPVDIQNPDFTRFPEFANAKPLNCTIDEGDVLFMPAFWWHEVQSYPNETEGRNLAINYWYEPFLKKDFPCQECSLDVNPEYRHLLRRFA